MRDLKDHKLVLQIPITVSMNELLDGMKVNTSVRLVHQAINGCMENLFIYEPAHPESSFTIPSLFEIQAYLLEHDLISTDIDEENY